MKNNVWFSPRNMKVREFLVERISNARLNIQSIFLSYLSCRFDDTEVGIHEIGEPEVGPIPDGVDYAIYISIGSPVGRKLADEIYDQIVQTLISIGMTADCVIEIHPSTLPGMYCTIREDKIVYSDLVCWI